MPRQKLDSPSGSRAISDSGIFHVERLKNHREMFHVEHLPQNIRNNLEIYKNLLLKWQKAINLVSRGTLNNIWARHIEDSLQLIPFLRGRTVLDIGSGGGFPGMVLAIVSKNIEFLKQFGITESFDVTCVDSDQRKMTFLSEVARQTSAKVELVLDRIENIDGKFDTLTARGFAELKVLIGFAKKYSNYGVFLKGKKVEQEIEDALKFFRFDYEIFNSVTEESGRIILVYNIEDVENLQHSA